MHSVEQMILCICGVSASILVVREMKRNDTKIDFMYKSLSKGPVLSNSLRLNNVCHNHDANIEIQTLHVLDKLHCCLSVVYH